MGFWEPVKQQKQSIVPTDAAVSVLWNIWVVEERRCNFQSLKLHADILFRCLVWASVEGETVPGQG